jgi:type II secretory ATPase GspE/PulE/Tfp pilus assembly ATPase PilB-like protein
MAFPLSDRIEPKHVNPVYQSVLDQFKEDWVEQLNIEQMFILIDGVLPFEACLYYQVLPLFLEGSHLNLGMVSPEDTAASDYVRRIISYLNYTLVPRRISSEALQAVLSAHLSHAGSHRPPAQPGRSPAGGRNPGRPRSKPPVNRNLQATLVVDSPESLNLTDIHERENSNTAPSPPPEIPFVPPQDAGAQPSAQPELAQPNPQNALLALPEPEQPEQEHSPASVPLLNSLPALDVQAKYLSSPVEVLATLQSKELLQELLGRILFGGIGRLYFERQQQHGRILWSQNGVLQSVIDKLDVTTFQGVINELKRMTQIPSISVDKPKQAEIERFYQQTRLLLRFRVMPTAHGEEATLQVLRGAALKFYQQQQLTNLGRDALDIAKQLQLKVDEIRDRARTSSNFSADRLEALPALNQLLHYIEAELEQLQVEKGADESKDEKNLNL